MKKIVLRYGLASGVVLLAIAGVMLPLCLNGTINFDQGEIVGFSTMILAFLMVFFGIRSYRDNVAGGTIGFGKAFQVGLLITLVTCAIYVIAWEITYYNFLPDFMDRYNAHVLERMRTDGETEAALQEKAAELAEMARLYANPLVNVAFTFIEVFPVGLIVTLVSAAILRRKPGDLVPAQA